MKYYLAAFAKYATFEGRARRAEYWMFFLFNLIVGLVLEALFFTTRSSIPLIVLGIYALATILPSLAVLVRRLHDQNKSGWWFWISLVPFIGGIWLLVLTLLQGTQGNNTYGADPKAVTA